MQRGGGNVLLYEYQPVEHFSEMFVAGDLYFISLCDGFEGLIVPNKFYSILAAGGAVVYEGCTDSELARMVVEGCGKVMPPGDVDQLEQVLIDYVRAPECLVSDGRKPPEAYERRFERSNLAQRCASVVVSNRR